MSLFVRKMPASRDDGDSMPLPGTRKDETPVMRRGGIVCQTALLNLMLPVMLDHFSLTEQVRLRRLDIAALVALLVCNISILCFLRMKRRREEKSLPWITWNGASPAPSNDHSAANRALLQWGVLAAAGLMGVSYSWITDHWIILPVFLAGGYWIGTRARKLLQH